MENKDIHGESFNFSNETPYSVLEIIQKIIDLMGSSLKPELLNCSINEIQDQYLSSTKAKKLLNWSSKFTLNNGLKETIDWYTHFLGNIGIRRTHEKID